MFERVFLPVQPCRLACTMPLGPAPRSIRVELMPACASKRSVHATRSLWILRQRFKSIYGVFFPPPRILGRCFSYLGAALACCTSLHPRSLYLQAPFISTHRSGQERTCVDSHASNNPRGILLCHCNTCAHALPDQRTSESLEINPCKHCRIQNRISAPTGAHPCTGIRASF